MQELKLIVAGGRDFNDYQLLSQCIMDIALVEYPDRAISIVSGMAKGADSLGYMFAVENNVRKYIFPANWNQYGKRAGMLRNKEMGNFSDVLLAFWDGQSRGTQQMIQFMGSLNKPVHIVRYNPVLLPIKPPEPVRSTNQTGAPS